MKGSVYSPISLLSDILARQNAKDNFVAKDDVRKKADLSGQFASDSSMPLLKPRFRFLQQHAPRQERGYWSQCARGVPSQGCR